VTVKTGGKATVNGTKRRALGSKRRQRVRAVGFVQPLKKLKTLKTPLNPLKTPLNPFKTSLKP
jgi:hypothetical protein